MDADKITEAVLKLMQELANALNGPAQQAFAILIQQYHNVGVVDLWISGVALLAAIVLTALFTLTIRFSIKALEPYNIFFLGSSVWSYTIAVICFVKGYLKVANPAYYAIQEILETIK